MLIPILGVGWGFPIKPEDSSAGARPNRLSVAEYEKSVQQSILIILSTAKGERVMHPTFGTSLRELVFGLNDSTTHATARFEVTEALKIWEPRIEVLDVKTATAGDRGEQLLIYIDYHVRTTDNRFNLVYPFYLDRPLT